MGSKRTLADPASQSAAEVQAGPPAAAAAADPQPSSSEQPFVNTGGPGQMTRLSISCRTTLQLTVASCLLQVS